MNTAITKSTCLYFSTIQGDLSISIDKSLLAPPFKNDCKFKMQVHVEYDEIPIVNKNRFERTFSFSSEC